MGIIVWNKRTLGDVDKYPKHVNILILGCNFWSCTLGLEGWGCKCFKVDEGRTTEKDSMWIQCNWIMLLGFAHIEEKSLGCTSSWEGKRNKNMSASFRKKRSREWNCSLIKFISLTWKKYNAKMWWSFVLLAMRKWQEMQDFCFHAFMVLSLVFLHGLKGHCRKTTHWCFWMLLVFTR